MRLGEKETESMLDARSPEDTRGELGNIPPAMTKENEQRRGTQVNDSHSFHQIGVGHGFFLPYLLVVQGDLLGGLRGPSQELPLHPTSRPQLLAFLGFRAPAA